MKSTARRPRIRTSRRIREYHSWGEIGLGGAGACRVTSRDSWFLLRAASLELAKFEERRTRQRGVRARGDLPQPPCGGCPIAALERDLRESLRGRRLFGIEL